MSSVLIDNMLSQHDYPTLDADSYPDFIYSNEYSVLFFANNPVQFPESNDVAVILPELLKAFPVDVKAALVGAAIERDLQRRYHFTRWPALVFLKQGEYLGAINGLLNWNEFVTKSLAILASSVSQPPAFDLDAVCTAKH